MHGAEQSPWKRKIGLLLTVFLAADSWADDRHAPRMVAAIHVITQRQGNSIEIEGTCWSGLPVLVSADSVNGLVRAPCNNGRFSARIATLGANPRLVTSNQIALNGNILYNAKELGVSLPSGGELVTLSNLQTRLDRAVPGNIFKLAAGTYPALSVSIARSGSLGKPIVLDGEGRVTITGRTQVHLVGDWVTLRGFIFQGGGSGIVVMSGAHARIAGSRFDSCGTTVHAACVKVNGSDAEIDFNDFVGSRSVSVEIIGGVNGGSVPGHAFVHHNRFIDIPRLSDNGQEPIQVAATGGTITTQSYWARIESNIFYKTNGDVESVSLKAADNFVIGNVFKYSNASPNLRGSVRNQISYNLLDSTFPIRIAGKDHSVIGNTIICPRGSSGVKLEDSWQGHESTIGAKITDNKFIGSGKAAIMYQPAQGENIVRASGSVVEHNTVNGMLLMPDSQREAFSKLNNKISNNLTDHSVDSKKSIICSSGTGND